MKVVLAAVAVRAAFAALSVSVMDANALFLLRKERKSAEVNGTDQPTVRRMRPIIRLFRHSRSLPFKGRSWTMAKKPKSSAPWLEECERNERGFRRHSFNRSVADLDFSPIGHQSRLEVQEGEWARNRIIGHGFRVAARPGRSVPFLPFPSAISVVKKRAATVGLEFDLTTA